MKEVLIGGGVYGLVRSPIADKVTPFVQNIGFIPNQYADEVAMGTLSWLATKLRNPTMKTIGRAGLIVETARLADGLRGGITGGSAPTNSTNVF